MNRRFTPCLRMDADFFHFWESYEDEKHVYEEKLASYDEQLVDVLRGLETDLGVVRPKAISL